MFIELPTSLAATADPAVDLPLDFDPADTFTAVHPRRGERAADAGSRMRLGLPRDARQWPWRASAPPAGAEVLTFTTGS